MNNRLTSNDLARICGVSQGTVDRALNNRPGINPATKEKVLKVAEELGYFPNIHAGKLAGGKSRLIGVVVFDLRNEYFSELVLAIDSYCRKLGYASVTMFSDKDRETEISCIRRLVSIGVDGMIICAVNKSEALEQIIAGEIPAVAVGNIVEALPYCGVDNFEAMKTLTKKACEACGTILYFSPALTSSPEDNISAQRLRYDGFCSAVQEVGKSYEVCTSLGDLKHAVRNADRPAVVCSTDYYAFQVFGRYPDIPLYSFDSTRLLPIINKKAVSVGVNADLIAENALKIILDKSCEDVFIEFELK